MARADDLADYFLHAERRTWLRNLQPGGGDAPAVRYVTGIREVGGGEIEFRWQSSGLRDQYYNVFSFSDRDGGALHYKSVHLNCDAIGAACEWRTVYTETLVYGPREVSGEARSGQGESRLETYFRGDSEPICRGTNRYTWEVVPYANELASYPRVDTARSKPIHLRSTQEIEIETTRDARACPTGRRRYQVDFWFATACNPPPLEECGKTLVLTKGGFLPYVADSSHWDLTFDRMEPPPSSGSEPSAGDGNG
jgi:hypothetical protein